MKLNDYIIINKLNHLYTELPGENFSRHLGYLDKFPDELPIYLCLEFNFKEELKCIPYTSSKI